MQGRNVGGFSTGRDRKWAAVPLAALAALMVLGCGDGAPTQAAPLEDQAAVTPDVFNGGGSEAFKILSRNVYIGADVAPVFQVDFNDIPALTAVAAALWQTVQQSDFQTRAEALADEVAATRPHVVGLQEVSRFVVLNGSLQPIAVVDYLQILQAALAARGLDYVQLSVLNNTNVTVPIALDLQSGTVTQLLDLTDRIAVLVRSDVTVHDVAQDNYATRFLLAPGVFLTRGWARVDAEFGGQRLHVVNTHLEGQSLAPIQAGQAAELMGPVTAGLIGPKVLIGDLNSDAAGGPGIPSWTPTYGELVGAGWVDLWAQAHPGGGAPEFTCCHLPDLSNTASSLAQRIDFVLVRDAPQSGSGRVLGSVKIEVLGEESGDRLGGLWPSDHAGLVAGLRLPPGKLAKGG